MTVFNVLDKKKSSKQNLLEQKFVEQLSKLIKIVKKVLIVYQYLYLIVYQ